MPATAPRRKSAKSPTRSPERGGAVTARDIMTKNVIVVTPATPLVEVERLIAEHHISGMPVVDGNTGRALGVVSYYDLVDHYTENPDQRPARYPGYFKLTTGELLREDFESLGIPPENATVVEEVMTNDVLSVPIDATVREIAKKMVRHEIHRVLVVDDTRRVVGIVGSFDVLKAVAKS
jgi:CBS domain-containing protein